MEKIDFVEFAKYCKKLNGKDVAISISNTVETTKIIQNAQILINANRIIISNEKRDEININVNYISNYYKERNLIRCKLDNELEISIYEIEE